MINRVLIRVKVVQSLYSYLFTRPDCTVRQAVSGLNKSFEQSYDFYLSLFKLIITLTDLQDQRLDDAKHKFLPTEEDLNPNTRFVDNALVQALRDNKTLEKLFEDRLIRWDDALFNRLMLDKVLNSDLYCDYMQAETADLHADTALWKKLLEQVILDDEDFAEYLENQSIYISTEDIDIMGQFAVKSLQRIANGTEDVIDPMFKDDEDRTFGENLLTKSIRDYDSNNVLIDSCINAETWDRNRVAAMDRVVMNVAVTEMKCFDNIPPQVTLNEYIELAKLFSTDRSGVFVNGVLNNVMKHLKQQGKLNN